MVINEIDGVEFFVSILSLGEFRRIMEDLSVERTWDLLGGMRASSFLVYEHTRVDTRFYLEDYGRGIYKHTPLARAIWKDGDFEVHEMYKGLPKPVLTNPFPIRTVLTPVDKMPMDDPNGSIFEGGSYYHSLFLDEPESVCVFNREDGIPFTEEFLRDKNEFSLTANFGDSGNQKEILRWLFYENRLISIDVPIKITIENLLISELVSRP